MFKRMRKDKKKHTHTTKLGMERKRRREREWERKMLRSSVSVEFCSVHLRYMQRSQCEYNTKEYLNKIFHSNSVICKRSSYVERCSFENEHNANAYKQIHTYARYVQRTARERESGFSHMCKPKHIRKM